MLSLLHLKTSKLNNKNENVGNKGLSLLRRAAENIVSNCSFGRENHPVNTEEVNKLLNEIQIVQLKLEMQNSKPLMKAWRQKE